MLKQFGICLDESMVLIVDGASFSVSAGAREEVLQKTDSQNHVQQGDAAGQPQHQQEQQVQQQQQQHQQQQQQQVNKKEK